MLFDAALAVLLTVVLLGSPAEASGNWVLWHVRESYDKNAFPSGAPRETMQRILESGFDRQACELVRANHLRSAQQSISIGTTRASPNGAVLYLSSSTTENSYLCMRAGERPRPAVPISPTAIPAPSSSTTILRGPAAPITPEEAAAMKKRAEEQSGSRKCETKVYGGGAAVTVCD